jgi:hypothetical protein
MQQFQTLKYKYQTYSVQSAHELLPPQKTGKTGRGGIRRGVIESHETAQQTMAGALGMKLAGHKHYRPRQAKPLCNRWQKDWRQGMRLKGRIIFSSAVSFTVFQCMATLLSALIPRTLSY